MRYFAKKEVDNSFGGWYLPEVHETMFEVIQHTQIENGEEIPYYTECKPKFDGVEYSEQEYNNFMKEVNKPNSELRFNSLGQLIIYYKKPRPKGLIQGSYDYITETWIESATLDEQLEYYKQEILKANRELLVYKELGFVNEELQNKLNELINKHNEISFDIGIKENKNWH